MPAIIQSAIYTAILSSCLAMAAAQTTPPPPAMDPLTVGKAALAKENYADADTFFATYLQTDPKNVEATFLEGNAALGLQHYDAAEKLFRAALTLAPNLWVAHNNLVIVYARSLRWKDFDAERDLLAKARAAHAPGLPETENGVIDVFTVGDQRWIVRAFDPLDGRVHTRYRFMHFGSDGTMEKWFACESDDIDQVAFAKQHPDLASQGKRSFSLDVYNAPKTGPNGQIQRSEGLIKFYFEGEPTYETVRTDVLSSLIHKPK